MLEEDETLYLNLTQSTKADLTHNQALATIINPKMSNQSPTDLNLSNSRIREHQPIEIVIGEFITTDPDTDNTFTYTLVSGTGSTDNNVFTIENNQLKTNAIFDYETKNFYNIRVRTTDQDGLSFEKALTINIDNVNEASLPIITNPISDVAVLDNSANLNIDLFTHFDAPLTTGQVATFELYNTDLAGGVINVLLFDQAQNGAPLTVNNFINYINDNDYDNSIIHRSIPGFVVQGGGFIVNSLFVNDVPTDLPIQNEFSANRSNLRGTIAMAKLEDDPDSATSQWFFSLEDNANNLDNQNGGFTVFGEVLEQSDLAVIDAIATVPVFNNLPLQIDPNNPVLNDDNDYVRFRDITVANLDELTFSVVSNSNPSLVNVSINNNQLILNYLDNQTGSAEITIQGTSLLGHTIEDTFNVTVNGTDNYLASNPDLIVAFGYNLEAARLHYQQSGINEGRPVDTFDEVLYLASNPDLISAFGYNPQAATQHYIQSGYLEGRQTNLFIPERYLDVYSDLKTAFGNDTAAATRHYIESGYREGRDFLTGFDPGAYIASHQDLIETLGYNPEAGRQHYVTTGYYEGREVTFEADDYLASHPDLIVAFSYNLNAAIEHYINVGASEGRIQDNFNEVNYLNKYADLQNAFGNDLVAATQHYIQSGYFEGRTDVIA